MESTPFLTIDNDLITLSDAIKYLKKTGGLPRMIADILRQYLLEKELNTRTDLTVDSLQVEQAVLDFRLQNQLTDANRYRTWLTANGISHEEFKNQVAFGIAVEKFKNELTQSQLEETFKNRKPLLDRVVLSRIVLNEKDLAEDIAKQIQANPSQFEPLARKYSLTEDKTVNGIMGPVRLGTLPPILKEELENNRPKNLIGPLEIDGRYCLFRYEEFLPATLESVKRELQNQLFEQWMQEKLAKMTIKLEVK